MREDGWDYKTVVLEKARSTDGFGIAISGGKDNPHFKTGDVAIIISDIVSGSPADGNLRIGDVLVSVNERLVDGGSHKDAVLALKAAGMQARLEIRRPAPMQPSPTKSRHPVDQLQDSANGTPAGSPKTDSDRGRPSRKKPRDMENESSEKSRRSRSRSRHKEEGENGEGGEKRERRSRSKNREDGEGGEKKERRSRSRNREDGEGGEKKERRSRSKHREDGEGGEKKERRSRSRNREDGEEGEKKERRSRSRHREDGEEGEKKERRSRSKHREEGEDGEKKERRSRSKHRAEGEEGEKKERRSRSRNREDGEDGEKKERRSRSRNREDGEEGEKKERRSRSRGRAEQGEESDQNVPKELKSRSRSKSRSRDDLTRSKSKESLHKSKDQLNGLPRDDLTTVVLNRGNQGYGFSLGQHIFIKDIAKGSPADTADPLSKGDIVYEINGTKLEDATIADCIEIIRAATEQVTLTVIKPKAAEQDPVPVKRKSSKPSRPVEAAEVDIVQKPKPIERDDPDNSQNDEKPRKTSKHSEKRPKSEDDESDIDSPVDKEPPVENYSSRDPHNETNDSWAAASPRKPPQSSTLPSNQEAENLDDKLERLKTGRKFDRRLTEMPDARVISFHKTGSVGIQVAGGNSVGIYVANVRPDSAAAKEGLKNGDQIIMCNEIDFEDITREEAVLILLALPDDVSLIVRETEMFEKIRSQLGDNFFIRANFDHTEKADAHELTFRKGEIFNVRDTMYQGLIGYWQAQRVGKNGQMYERGILPNKSRAEQLALAQKMEERQATIPGRSKVKRKGSVGGTLKKHKFVSQDKLDESSFAEGVQVPAYERVVLKVADFMRPVVVLGPLGDLVRLKLLEEMPDRFDLPTPTDLGGRNIQANESYSSSIKLSEIRNVIAKNKHCLLDITPEGIEMLMYAQLCPIVILLKSPSRGVVRDMRQSLVSELRSSPTGVPGFDGDPLNAKMIKKQFANAKNIEEYYPHILTAKINSHIAGGDKLSREFFYKLKETIFNQQAQSAWMPEDKLDEMLDDMVFHQPNYQSYLSGMDSDTEGESTTSSPVLARKHVEDEEERPETPPAEPVKQASTPKKSREKSRDRKGDRDESGDRDRRRSRHRSKERHRKEEKDDSPSEEPIVKENEQHNEDEPYDYEPATMDSPKGKKYRDESPKNSKHRNEEESPRVPRHRNEEDSPRAAPRHRKEEESPRAPRRRSVEESPKIPKRHNEDENYYRPPPPKENGYDDRPNINYRDQYEPPRDEPKQRHPYDYDDYYRGTPPVDREIKKTVEQHMREPPRYQDEEEEEDIPALRDPNYGSPKVFPDSPPSRRPPEIKAKPTKPAVNAVKVFPNEMNDVNEKRRSLKRIPDQEEIDAQAYEDYNKPPPPPPSTDNVPAKVLTLQERMSRFQQKVTSVPRSAPPPVPSPTEEPPPPSRPAAPRNYVIDARNRNAPRRDIYAQNAYKPKAQFAEITHVNARNNTEAPYVNVRNDRPIESTSAPRYPGYDYVKPNYSNRPTTNNLPNNRNSAIDDYRNVPSYDRVTNNYKNPPTYQNDDYPPYKLNNSTNSLPDNHRPNSHGEDEPRVIATARGTFDHRGGLLESQETNVSIYIPAGALPEGKKQEVYFKVCQDSKYMPPLDSSSGETLLSPLVMCGPHGLKFRKPIELRLPHKGASNDSMAFSLKSSDSPVGHPAQWRNVKLGGKDLDSGRAYQVTDDTVSVLVDHF